MVQLFPTAWKIPLKIWQNRQNLPLEVARNPQKLSGMLCKKNTTTNEKYSLQDMFLIKQAPKSHQSAHSIGLYLALLLNRMFVASHKYNCTLGAVCPVQTKLPELYPWNYFSIQLQMIFGGLTPELLLGGCITWLLFLNKHFLRSFLFSLDLVIRMATAAWGSVVLHWATVSSAHCTKACAVGYLGIVAHTPDRQNVELQYGHGSSAPLQISKFRI